ncbi:MAG: endonuclease [Bacteroidales bacterium]|nr:endonuclease [Bacteroidales bacterium]
MTKKDILLIISLFTTFFTTSAQPDPYNGYYNSALGKKGDELKSALFEIIKNNDFVDYDALWAYFSLTDNKGDGVVWDIYSDIPDGEPPYTYSFSVNQCGNYGKEGDCYNREHSVPNSWFGGNSMKPYHIYSDLCHLYPTDGFVNNKRGNMPYGVVASSKWVSANGSKIGKNTYSDDYTDDVFEPIDEYKGDLARTYFYMSLRYKDYNFSQDAMSVFTYSTLKPWALNLFREWNTFDKVSSKEKDRNNAIQTVQKNRNPFIDFPQLAEYIWGDSTDYVFQPYIATSITDYQGITSYYLYPNPTKEKFSIANFEMQIKDVTIVNSLGQTTFKVENTTNPVISIDITSWKSGIYFVRITDTEHTETLKLVIQ